MKCKTTANHSHRLDPIGITLHRYLCPAATGISWQYSARNAERGWQDISKYFSLPYRDIAITLGIGWLAFLVVSDAIISPSGTGNIYMNATPRVIYGWARAGTFFNVFTRLDNESGIPVLRCG